MQYRRNTIDGGTYFFTVNLAERSRHWLVEHVDALREAVRIVKERHPFDVDAMVILPDHLHAVWTLPPGDAEYSTRWMLIKAGFSRRIPAGERINASRHSKGNAAFGNADIGNTPFATTRIYDGTSITCITTPSNMDM